MPLNTLNMQDDNELTPAEFLGHMKKEGVPIPGIGHRIKSLKNPDKRVEGSKEIMQQENFPKYSVIGLCIELLKQLTTSKKENLDP